MKVNAEQIKKGLTNYIDEEIANKSNGLRQFVVYMAIPMIRRNAEELMNKYADNPLFNGFIDGDEVELDEVYDMAKEAMRKTGKVEISGILFDDGDLDKLYEHIKRS